MKDQGYGWGEVIVQGRNADHEALAASVGKAVSAELAKGGSVIISDEANAMRGKSLPLVYCAEIIDRPGVRAAIGKAVAGTRSSR